MTFDPDKSSEHDDHDLANWYAVATRTGQEEKARVNLERQGYLVFLPKVSVKKRRRGQWVVVTESLFAGYLFIFLELGRDDPVPLRSTLGCVGLVRFGQLYVPVPRKLISALQVAELQRHGAQLPLGSGDTVRLLSGPLAGFEAVFDMPVGDDRAQVLLQLLGKVQRLTVKINDLDK